MQMKQDLHPVDIGGAEHYTWGDACEAWHLLKRDDISVIEERIPPGKSEKPHFHEVSRQFFFILEGEATMATGSQKVLLRQHQGIEIPPGIPHQLCNDSAEDVLFLVISVPKSHGDRHEAQMEK